MSEPRYVLSADGFDVYDSWYCYQEAYRTQRKGVGSSGWGVLGREVPLAHALTYRALESLNAAHDAWLREDAEATEGMVSC